MKATAWDVLLGILFVGGMILVVLKLMDVITLEWWQVLIPIGAVVIYYVVLLAFGVVAIVAIFLGTIVREVWTSGRGRRSQQRRRGVRRGR